jgi:F0F1-type ATP synthase assembly protein I
MSEMTTPPKFIAATSVGLFIGTFVATWASESLVVFIVGLGLTMGLSRAMIGIGRN